MSLVAGTVTINPNGTYTGTGLAKTLMDAKVTSWDASPLPLPIRLTMYEAYRREAEATASALVAFITANAVVSVAVPANAIDPGIPSAPRTLTGTVG